VGHHSVAGKMFGGKPQHRRDCPIPNVIGIRCQAEKTAAKLQHPIGAGQHCSLVEHVLESTDANRQIDRLVRDSFQLRGIIHLERKIGSTRRVPKTSARQFDHAGRDIDPDSTSYSGSKAEEVMAIAAPEVKDDIGGPGPGPASHERESVFEQPLRVTVLLGRSR
jgi:hypothetical protein